MGDAKKKWLQEIVVFMAIAFFLPFIAITILHVFTIPSAGIWLYLITGIAMLSPILGGIISLLIFRGKTRTLIYFKAVFSRKFPIYLTVLAFIVPALAMLIGRLLCYDSEQLLPFISMPTTLVTAIWSPIGEEFGWRGFLREHLRSRAGLVITIVCISAIWCAWHYWLFLIPDKFKIEIPILWFFIGCVADTVWMIWLVEKAKGSICPAMIYHFSYNLFYNCIPIKPEFYAGSIKAYAVLSIVILGSGIIAFILDRILNHQKGLYAKTS